MVIVFGTIYVLQKFGQEPATGQLESIITKFL